ncbi:MAG: hypothetical protein MUC56_08730 [Thermoanaerobaculales bacterium]|jgi:hypothetical protein|nr:hypothetical protein [Thermoanaerobaculales bacterium]
MKRRVLGLLLMAALSSPALALELVANGGFESDLPPAWQTELVGAATVVNRAAGYDPDPDYEVLAEKGTGDGYARVNQTVVIPALDLEFSVNLRVQAASSSGPWAAAGVALHYENHLGDLLGTTMIVGRTADCPWIDHDTLHLIPAPDEEWHGYSFNVLDELANLPGVELPAIRKIRISLFGQVGGDC